MTKIGIFKDVDRLNFWREFYQVCGVKTDPRWESERWVLYADCNQGDAYRINWACGLAWGMSHPKRNILKSIIAWLRRK